MKNCFTEISCSISQQKFHHKHMLSLHFYIYKLYYNYVLLFQLNYLPKIENSIAFILLHVVEVISL